MYSSTCAVYVFLAASALFKTSSRDSSKYMRPATDAVSAPRRRAVLQRTVVLVELCALRLSTQHRHGHVQPTHFHLGLLHRHADLLQRADGTRTAAVGSTKHAPQRAPAPTHRTVVSSFARTSTYLLCASFVSTICRGPLGAAAGADDDAAATLTLHRLPSAPTPPHMHTTSHTLFRANLCAMRLCAAVSFITKRGDGA